MELVVLEAMAGGLRGHGLGPLGQPHQSKFYYLAPPQKIHGTAREHQEPSGAKLKNRTDHRNRKPSLKVTSGALTGSLSKQFHFRDMRP